MNAGRWILVLLVAGLLAATGCNGGQTPGEPDPDSPQGLTERATHAYLQGQTEQAIDLCRRVLVAEPDSVRAHLVMGMAFRLAADRASGAEREALRREEMAALTKAAELDPKNLAARIDLASSLQKSGDQQRAAEQLKRAAELTPGAAWTKDAAPKTPDEDPAGQAAEEPGEQTPEKPGANLDQPQEP